MLKHLKRSIILIAVAMVAALGLLLTAHNQLNESIDLPADKASITWVIGKGSSLTRVNRELHEAKILSHPRLLSLYARLVDLTAIQAGQYQIEQGDSALQLLDRFNRGDVVRYQITFPEGWTMVIK